jgi:MoaA/NifB/PqqE/SkfB family radical SAM enzyme
VRKILSGDIQARSVMMWSARRHARFLARHMTPRRLANIALCLWEMETRRAVVRSHPFYLRVGVSELCNLRCPGCLLTQGMVPFDPDRPRLMTLAVFREAVHDFLPWALKVNLYDEGEPLLNPDLPEMVRHLTDHGVGACVSSNFSMKLSDSYLTRLIDSGLEHLIVCVDGISQDTYEAYRQGGNLQVVLTNLRRLLTLQRERGRRLPAVEMQFIEFDHNRHEKPMVEALARETGVWRFVVVQGSSAEGWRGTDFHGSEDERRWRGCYQLWVSTHIAGDGSLGTCDYGEDHGIPTVGRASNYRAHGLRNHDRLVRLRHDFRDSASPLHEVCRSCSLYRRA